MLPRMLSVKQGIFSLKMSTSSKSFDAACLQRFFFDDTSKYRKTVEFHARIECKQTERADEKQPSSYCYRCFWFTDEIAAIK